MSVGCNRFSKTLLLSAVFVLGLAQCSNQKSLADKAELAILPDTPIVISSKVIINNQEIADPWFKFQVEMTNNTGKTITIQAVKVRVSALVAGQTVVNEKTFDPSDFNYSVGDVTCTYSFFGEYTSAKSRIVLEPDQPPASGCLTYFPVFYVGGNPKPPAGSTSPNYRYHVELQPLGWFGTRDDPEDRFDRKIFFYTQ